ncbi:MAG: NADP-dependent oxidoreductase [Planctomycetota bacterium]|nr:NADP-dependent oxidoreductase [Planctomycetota bacterium]
MSQTMSREIRLKCFPDGIPRESDFEIVEVSLAEPGEAKMLVRNIYMSVDPYMRLRMDLRRKFSPFSLNQTLDGASVGQVVKSKVRGFDAGDYVKSSMGWREYFLSDGTGLQRLESNIAPIQAHLGVLGATGMTAYVGIYEIGKPQDGETVFVSGASGAVGSIACQIAKNIGCRVIGSAGSDEKVAWLIEEAGVDAAFNYKNVNDLTAELGKHCPDGIDVYFENVGGKHLEAALEHMNVFGRIVLCGMISHYNETGQSEAPSNLVTTVGKRLTLRGFTPSDHPVRCGQFYKDMGDWISEGRIKWKETLFDGIGSAPRAFMGLFSGENIGKMIVKVGEVNS